MSTMVINRLNNYEKALNISFYKQTHAQTTLENNFNYYAFNLKKTIFSTHFQVELNPKVASFYLLILLKNTHITACEEVIEDIN
eukprot:m.51312 g.51312  ORF g.51312 m.51312 type:complete len:84 (-) comp7558_c0_seq1:1223-1474(-)